MRKRAYRSLAPHLERYLRENGPCTSYDMATALGVKPASVSAAMIQLVRKGLAHRSDQLAGVTTRAVWAVSVEDEIQVMRVLHQWLGVGEWKLPEEIPRTSVFDTRFIGEIDGQ